MRRLAIFTVAFLLAAAPAAAAPAIGVIRGRVINRTTGEPQAGVTVTLRGRAEDGDRLVRRQRTEAGGRYRFGALRTGSGWVYAIEGDYRGGLFAGRALSIPSQSHPAPVVTSKLSVWETTSDPRAVVVERDDLFIRPAGSELGVIESVVVSNPTGRAYIGRAEDMGSGAPGRAASLGFALPADGVCRAGQCGIVHSEPVTIPVLVRRDYGFAATVAIPPGRTQVTYSYRVRGSGGAFDLSRPALYPTAEASVYATEPLVVESDRLVATGERTIGDDRYRVWSTREGLDAGDNLQVSAVAEADASAALQTGAALLGTAVAVAVAVGVGVALLLRRRARASIDRPPMTRAELLRSIVELDAAFEAGRLDPDRWARERSELKARLGQEAKADSEPVA